MDGRVSKPLPDFNSFALYQKWPMGSIAFLFLNQNFKHIALDNHFYKAWLSEKDGDVVLKN
jgi:hypothetical protein